MTRFINALKREKNDCTPIWVMRQAGRYLPEYREVRAQAGDFMTLCRTPELACEVTLQPLRRFDLDAAIIFSDILTVPDAMGLGLYFVEGEGPKFKNPVTSVAEIDRLAVPDMAELGYVASAIRLTKKNLAGKVPLIGFSGSPWTLATYMVEGGASKTFSKIKKLCFAEPAAAHQLLNVLAESVSAYLQMQIDAGADAVMIFDTWGGVLSKQDYLTFSLAYMKMIVKALGGQVPVVLFTKNGGKCLEEMIATGCDGVGLDWTIDLKEARMRVGDKVTLQGNLDPCVLYATPEVIRERVKNILESYGHGHGHVFNLGHGIHPDVPPENVKVLVDAVHEFSKEYHQ